MIDAMSEGNLGAVMMLREEYDKAIPLFESSLDKALKFKDIPFAANRAVDLANTYLKKNNLPKAKKYIDLAITYRNQTKVPRNNDLFYEVLSKYYTATGDPKQSIAFMDLMLEEKKQDETKFNALGLLRMEQKEAAVRQLAFEQETIKRQQAQRLLMVFALGLMIIICLSGVLLMLYRRKRKAYRELVRKSQEWAFADIETPDDFDKLLFDQLKELMTTKQIYQDPGITLDSTAKLMNVNRNYLSQAINKCTNENFNTYINEFRIKEAVRIMSDNNSQKFSIEGIAINSGFNDRITFYRTFKKMTGLSPSEFRNNVR
jgi:YesN/AraC family two-component response regulator